MEIEPRITKVALLEQDRAIINQHLSEYIAFTIDKKTLIDSLYKKGKCQFQIRIDEKHDWTIDLQFNDMRAPNYKQTYVSDEGMFEYEQFRVNTFKGTTSNDQIARFTIDENNFTGVIFDKESHYVIRPINDFTKNYSDERLVVYKNSALILKDEMYNYVSDVMELPNNAKIRQQEGSILRNGFTPCTYYLEIAIDADYEFYHWLGDRSPQFILSILNVVEGVYESTFDLKFIVTYQNVWTIQSNDYPYTSTDYITLIRQFQTYWNANMTNVPRDVAHLFTRKEIGAGGIAWVATLGRSSISYAVSKIRHDYYHIVTHEIAHNLNATDLSLWATIPSECLCSEIVNTGSVMCYGERTSNIWFCQPSIDEISPYLANNSHLLTSPFPDSLNVTGTIDGVNEYSALQKITSNQIVNSGNTTYKASEVELEAGFEVKLGAECEIIIDNNDCQ